MRERLSERAASGCEELLSRYRGNTTARPITVGVVMVLRDHCSNI